MSENIMFQAKPKECSFSFRDQVLDKMSNEIFFYFLAFHLEYILLKRNVSPGFAHVNLMIFCLPTVPKRKVLQ